MRKTDLKENERIDDLCRDGKGIIQNTKGFLFGVDAVFLTDFARIKEGASVLDLCTGSGIIPILLALKTKASSIKGIEIQEEVADMASRSVYMDELEDKVEIVCGDIKNIRDHFTPHSFDVVTVNPPYTKAEHGIKGENTPRIIARHEIMCDLSDVMEAAALMLKPEGLLFMVHRPQRIPDIFVEMREKKIEPKRMKLAYPTEDSEPNLVFIEGKSNGKSELRIEPPFIISNEP